MKPLNSNILEEHHKFAEQASKLHKQINDRVDYIMQTIAKIFYNKNNITWEYFDPDANDSYECYHTFGNFWTSIIGDNVKIDIDDDRYIKLSYIDKNNIKRNIYQEGFPKSWMFEDFEQELIDGKKNLEDLYLKQSEEIKQEKDNQKIVKEKLIESIKNKLSKEELKLVSIKKK